MNLWVSSINRDTALVPLLPPVLSSVQDIHIGQTTSLFNPTAFSSTDLLSLSSSSLEASASYKHLVETDDGFGSLDYSYFKDELNFSLSLSGSEFKADLQGNVSFRQDTLNIKLQIQIEELNVEKNKGNSKKARGEFKHFQLSFDLERSSFEYLLKGSGDKNKTSDLVFKLLNELSKISLKDEKKSILILFGNKEAVGTLTGKIGMKVMELVLFIVTVSHLNRTNLKTHYNIWLYGGGQGEERESFLYSFQKMHFELDFITGGKIKGNNGKHKGWFKPGDG